MTGSTHLIEMPYWATVSKPAFHTSVTSQAFVACRRHERKAETAFPPTEATHQLVRRCRPITLRRFLYMVTTARRRRRTGYDEKRIKRAGKDRNWQGGRE